MTARPDMAPNSILETTGSTGHECSPALSQHVLKECHLATAQTSGQKADRSNNSWSSAVEEDVFMHDAPKLARQNLGLPADASSKDVVDKFISFTVDNFKQKSPAALKNTMDFVDIDKQTQKDVIAHKPGWTRELGAAILQKEKDYFEIPSNRPMTAADYQKLENGILLDSYRNQRDVQRLYKFMKEDQK